MAPVGLQAPWITYFEKVKALFANDNEIEVSDYLTKATYSNQDDVGKGVYTIKIDSANGDKIEALRKIMKNNIPMGNIVLKIQFGVINSETGENVTVDSAEVYPTIDDYKVAFADNTILVGGEHVELPNGFVADYLLFSKEIIQFYNDDLSDLYGNYNGLPEDVARELLIAKAGIYYCTEQK